VPDARPPARITVREILSADDPAFSPAHALLRREFSRAEMLPVRDWRNAMRERREGLWSDIAWHLLVAQRGSTIVAAATGSYLGNVNVGVIGYIAVRPAARASGLGPRMRRTLLRKFAADARRAGHASLTAIVGEVRADNPWLRHLARRESIIALDFPYVQPSLGGTRRPVPLVMYYQSLDRPRTSLGAAELRRLLFTIWRRAYRVSRPLAHPEFRRMLRALEGRRRIGSRPLSPRTS
jgi:GNAT superfamily N-acetyltransferase